MKKYLIGFISGALLATVGSVYASDALEKVEAYLKPQSVKLNGQSVALENPAIVYDGSTYLKVRDIGKITGLHVDWNAETETVELNSGKENSVTPSPANDPTMADGDITDYLQIRDIVNGPFNHVYDKDANVMKCYLTDLQYQTYKRIKSKQLQVLFLTKSNGSSEELAKYSELFGNESYREAKLQWEYIYKGQTVLVFYDDKDNLTKDLDMK
ncbi:stalk domain-containing protein [Paenibacillus sp. y28]|uniref:stalk domain-containing protein n=1 Tax=Paenibacillus sp. y28 TaxID=3129110 RepID=UPI00301B4CF7